MQLTLIVLNGPGKGHVFQLEDTGEPAPVGRQAPLLKLRDSEVSRRHAEIRCENNTWVIRDLGSTNGTYVNGRRIEILTELEEGDQVLIGRVLLVVGQIITDEIQDTHEPPETEAHATPTAPSMSTMRPVPAGAIDEDDEDFFEDGPVEPLVLGLASEADALLTDADVDDDWDELAPPLAKVEPGPEREPEPARRRPALEELRELDAAEKSEPGEADLPSGVDSADEDAVLRQLAELAEEDDASVDLSNDGDDDDALAALRDVAADEVDTLPEGDEAPDSLFGAQVEKSLQVPLDPHDAGDLLLDEDEPVIAADDDPDADLDDDAPPAAAAPAAVVPPVTPARSKGVRVEAALPPEPSEDESNGTGLLHHIGLSENESDTGEDELLRPVADSNDDAVDEIDDERAMSQETGESLAALRGDEVEEGAEERGINLAGLLPDQPKAEAATSDIAAAIQTHVPYQQRGGAGGAARVDAEAADLIFAPKLAAPNRPATAAPVTPPAERASGARRGAIAVLLTSLVVAGAATGLWFAADAGYVHLPRVSLGDLASTGVGSHDATPAPVPAPPISLTPPPVPSEPAESGEQRQRLLRELASTVPPEASADAETDGPMLLRDAVMNQRAAADTQVFATSPTPALPDTPAPAAAPAPAPEDEPPLAMAVQPPSETVVAAEVPPVAIAPPAAVAPATRRVAYLVDASGSLIDTLGLVVDWLSGELQQLEPEAEFTVMFFRDGEAIEAPPRGLDRATTKAIETTARWMQPAEGNVIPSGRSDPAAALQLAVGYGVDEVVILSDDSISSRMTQEKIDLMLMRLDGVVAGRDVKVHTVQFFYRDPMRVLETLAQRYGGTYRFVEPEQPGGPDPLEAISNLTAAPTRQPAAP